MKTKIILRDVTGQWILVLATWCVLVSLVFGDFWPNLPGQPSLSPTMAETRAEQDRQNRQEGFEVLPNVTVLIIFYLNEGGKKVLIHKEKSRFPFSATAYRDLEVLKKTVRFCGVQAIAEVKGLGKNIETSFTRTVRSLGTVESFCLRTQKQWENEMVFFLERESILQGMLTYVMLAP